MDINGGTVKLGDKVLAGGKLGILESIYESTPNIRFADGTLHPFKLKNISKPTDERAKSIVPDQDLESLDKQFDELTKLYKFHGIYLAKVPLSKASPKPVDMVAAVKDAMEKS